MDLSSILRSSRKTPGLRTWIPLMILFTLIPIEGKLYSQASGEITTLETDNSFPGVWCCANDGYLYGVGVNIRTVVFRKRENGQEYERRGSVTTVDPSFIIVNRMYSTSVPGLIFVLVRNNTTQVHHLLKSADGGLTFSKVFTFGQGNAQDGSDSRDVRLLRGLLELTTDLPGGGGKGTLFIGEYNVNQSRSAGSFNDRVRIMKSTDNGDTWTKVVEWNTNGKNQVGHIHAMKQDPYTGEIYICIGDFSNKFGILKWDGAASFPDNTPLPEIADMPGFKGLIGMQRYRTCDVLFDTNYFYTFADTQGPNNPNGAESGIWRGKKDFSSYTRVDNQIYDYDPMHIGWFGEKIGNTFIFTTSREYSSALGWKELNTRIYISNNGANWFCTGQLNWRDTGNPTEGVFITSVFSYSDKMYMDCYSAAGHGSTIQCSLSRQWKSYDDPVILHPVYFVGKWNNDGNDNNAGTNADAPKMTLGNILNNSRISAGSRVRISQGTFNEPALNPSWNASALPGKGSVVIEGRGMDQTHIVRSSGGSGTYGLFLEKASSLTDENTPLVLKDLDFYLTADGGTEHNNYLLYTTDSYIKTIHCRIGNELNDDSPLVHLQGTGAKYVSVNSIHTASSQTSEYKDIVKVSSAGTIIDMKNCVILNGFNSFTINYPETSLSLKYCTIYGTGNNGITLGENNNMQPLIKDCILSCIKYPIEDLSGISETQIDYNLYCSRNNNVTDGGHSPEAGASPGFVDPEHGDFNLKPDSPGVMSGISLTDVPYDITGRHRSNPSFLGAYENSALIVMPDSITIEAGSGSQTEFSVRSNTNWTIDDFDNWINLSVTSGRGSTNVSVVANSSNITDKARNTDLRISGQGTGLVTIHVVQLPDITTSSKETEKLPVAIYPNPVSSFLKVELNDEDFSIISILNLQGDILRKENVTEKEQMIDFSGFPKGVYIIELKSSVKKAKRFKVIKS
jgi:hypothetical protein